jgi:DNA-binding response OmpR family regulator
MSRIVLLSAHPTLAHTFALSLSLKGFSALALTCPDDALKLIRNTDVLVIDCHLPGTTGLEVARQAYDSGWRGGLLLMSGQAAAMAFTAFHFAKAVFGPGTHRGFGARL